MTDESVDKLGPITTAFPFFFVLDGSMHLVRAGDRLLQVVPELALGEPLDRGLRFERPMLIKRIDDIIEHKRDVFLLACTTESELRLRGQFFLIESGSDSVVFLGHPWITTLEQLDRTGLHLSDFPPHAGITDMLVLAQAKTSSLDEARKLANQLRKISRELQLRNEQLEHELKERKRLEDTVLQSQKMEAIGQLAGGVAHDFNNILLAINGFVMLTSRSLDSEHSAQEHLEHIRNATRRAAELTSRLLAFGQRQVMAPLPIDIKEAMGELQEILAPLIGETVQLSVDIDGDLGLVLADPPSFQQVFLNLILNARDAFEKPGTVQVHCSLVKLSEPRVLVRGTLGEGMWIKIVVRDNGSGIDKDILDRIFEPFFTTKQPGKGTGLGLATVWWIVERSGWVIDVESAPSVGSTFTVYMPKSEAVQAHASAKSEPYVEADEEGRVLLVEDEPLAREAVEMMLKLSGWIVTSASNGEEAMEKANAAIIPFDIVLTDMVMPGMTGRELAIELRARWPAMPIVFMTGYDPEAQGDASPGSEPILAKPFSQNKLMATLARAR